MQEAGAVQSKLVAIDVPRGSGYDSQAASTTCFPRSYGRLADEGCGRRIAFVVIHPTSNFMGHYLIGPLQRRGYAILGLNTRYVANDSTLIIERAIQDLGAGIGYLRKLGYERIVLLGNSGGGSLAAFYQAEAEQISVATTPDGVAFELRPEQVPPVDGMAMLAAHPGRALTMVERMIPPWSTTGHVRNRRGARHVQPGEWSAVRSRLAARYRTAQRARNDRITDWVLARLAALEANADQTLIKDEPFIVHRTVAHRASSTCDRSERPRGERATFELRPDQSWSVFDAALVPQPVERQAVTRRRSGLHGTHVGSGAECAVFRRCAGVSGAGPAVVAGCRRSLPGPCAEGATHSRAGQA